MAQRGLRNAICLALSFLVLSFFLTQAFGWSNGGYSDDPHNPNYGTHDWIAEHALDWLPGEEKFFILENLEFFLYGTELPDNSHAIDGIGDTSKHHVYYRKDGSLQDDASAVRAQEEFEAALSLYLSGDILGAVKRLGVMTHYISDVAVFGHVMGKATDWGEEKHHSDYEREVNERTSSYESAFNIYLFFDGNLELISAYNATLKLAYDTTFDISGKNRTCIWMDENYNWSNPQFIDRCGESLNYAVNLIADVLHTFYLEIIKLDSDPPEISVPEQNPPADNVQPGQNVLVRVNVTDHLTSIKNVTLWYKMGDETDWTIVCMAKISQNTYQAEIPGCEGEVWVVYKIVAYDGAGNSAIKDNHGYYYRYYVIPEYPFIALPLLTLILATLILKFLNRKRRGG
ncbi:MAG: zinc dependent phospholipase C family protein [Candidatus Bathyarchaeia archaeon]